MESEHPIASRLPGAVHEPFRTALIAACDLWIPHLGDNLVSLVLFGSVARGDSNEHSDIDLLLVARGLPRRLADRRRPLLELWRELRGERELPAVHWNLLAKSLEEARTHSPVYLDMVEDAVLLYDQGGFFAGVLHEMQRRMEALGSRRVFLDDGSWYWDLKPSFRFGEVVEI